MTLRATAEQAVLEVADRTEHLGAFLGQDDLGDGVVILRFTATHPGYPGWRWSVACVGDDAASTVSEVWMEPAEGALLAPAWRPWSERVRPGDLGAGDVVATDPTDARLTAGYTGVDDLDDLDAPLHPVQWAVGLGRERVLSAEGIADAAERWLQGEDGPQSQMARLADHPCSTCAWLLPIGGVLGQAFGVCAHDMSPSDGHIVAMDHGCGAHSNVKIDGSSVEVAELIIDDTQEFADVDATIGLTAETPVADEAADEPASAEAAGVEQDEQQPSADAESAALEPAAALDDVTGSQDTDDDAGVGDVTPPEDVVVGE